MTDRDVLAEMLDVSWEEFEDFGRRVSTGHVLRVEEAAAVGVRLCEIARAEGVEEGLQRALKAASAYLLETEMDALLSDLGTEASP